MRIRRGHSSHSGYRIGKELRCSAGGLLLDLDGTHGGLFVASRWPHLGQRDFLSMLRMALASIWSWRDHPEATPRPPRCHIKVHAPLGASSRDERKDETRYGVAAASVASRATATGLRYDPRQPPPGGRVGAEDAHDPKVKNGAASLRSRLVPTVPHGSKPWSQANPDFPGQKGRLVPMTPFGPSGFGHGDKDVGTMLFPRSAVNSDPNWSLKLPIRSKRNKEHKGRWHRANFSVSLRSPETHPLVGVADASSLSRSTAAALGLSSSLAASATRRRPSLRS